MVNGNIKLSDGYIKLPKLKWIKFKQHREIPAHHIIKACTITKTKTGKVFIEFAAKPVTAPNEVTSAVPSVIATAFVLAVFIDNTLLSMVIPP